MKITSETNLRDFEFWSGAVEKVGYLTLEELDTIESVLEEVYPEGIDKTIINDIFWFEDDTIAQWLGYNNFDQIMERENT